jgi:YHS domain-containing protein
MKMKNKFLAGVAGLSAIFLATVLVVHAQDTTTNAAPATASAGKPVPYPLDYCVVSGDKLGGDMGDPVTFIYTNNGVNQEIKFCCPMCKPKFLKDPDKYMKVIRAAEAAQKK